MRCPRCNNTHWIPEPRQLATDYARLVVLQRPFRCLKCDKIMNGPFWLSGGRSKPKNKQGAGRACPKCGEPARRSRRRRLERMLIFWRAYRCGKCEVRFLGFR